MMISRPPNNVAGRPRGFTFIELMFVMITLGIVMAAVLPRFGESFDRLRTERVAFETAQLLRYAQSTAVVQRQVIECSLESEGRPLALGIRRGDELTPLADRWAKGRPIPEPVRLAMTRDESKEDAVSFFPDGTSDGATIAVGDESGSAFQIAVDAATGQVTILPGTAAL